MTPDALPELHLSPAAKACLRLAIQDHSDIDAAETKAVEDGLEGAWRRTPAWRELRDAIVTMVGRFGYIVLRGLEPDDGRSALCLSTALGREFGTYGDGRIVKRFRLSPWTQALSHTLKAGDFHTDGNVSQDPPSATLMQCEVDDPGGPDCAEQRVAHLPQLLAFLQDRDLDSLRFLTEQDQAMAHENSPTVWRGRLVQGEVIRYHPESLRLAAKRLGEQPKGLDDRITAIHDAALAVSKPFRSRPGDVLIVSNAHALHYRGACSVRFIDFPNAFETRSLLVLHRHGQDA